MISLSIIDDDDDDDAILSFTCVQHAADYNTV